MQAALRKLVGRLQSEPAAPPTEASRFERCQLAVAALLIEAAHIDRRALPDERAAIGALLEERFHLPGDEAQALVQAAEQHYAATLDDWIFAHTVRRCFEPAARADVIRMLWEVVYEDGRLAKLELELLNRLASAVEVDEETAERVRIEAFAAAHPSDSGEADEP